MINLLPRVLLDSELIVTLDLTLPQVEAVLDGNMRGVHREVLNILTNPQPIMRLLHPGDLCQLTFFMMRSARPRTASE